jgi:hypothetical protein
LNKWALLEYPSELTEAVSAINCLFPDESGEFLWGDSSLTWKKSWSLREMVQEMDSKAKNDIDGIPRIVKRFKEETKGKLETVERFWKKFLE